eukprot:8720843-Alexandrium_andersonii.AAC.1
MGNPAIVHTFAHTYKGSVAEWQRRQRSWDESCEELWAVCPITGRRIDCSLTVFADDLAKMMVLEVNSAEHVAWK